jgi:hypothetical protein
VSFDIAQTRIVSTQIIRRLTFSAPYLKNEAARVRDIAGYGGARSGLPLCGPGYLNIGGVGLIKDEGWTSATKRNRASRRVTMS